MEIVFVFWKQDFLYEFILLSIKSFKIDLQKKIILAYF